MLNPRTLDAITECLNAAGWNYTVFLRSYEAGIAHGDSAERIVQKVLGPEALVDSAGEVTTAEMLAEVRDSLSYVGEHAGGPDADVLRSELFADLLSRLAAELEESARHASRIEQLGFKRGHPAYPVYWEFAFLLIEPARATLLIGSSSD
jgi:hypothetical protein